MSETPHRRDIQKYGAMRATFSEMQDIIAVVCIFAMNIGVSDTLYIDHPLSPVAIFPLVLPRVINIIQRVTRYAKQQCSRELDARSSATIVASFKLAVLS